MKTLNINSGKFVIGNGYIKSDTPFKVVEKDDTIIIGDEGCKTTSNANVIGINNSIIGNATGNVINGNCIIVNGISISYDNNTLNINGDVDKIILNGKTLSIDNKLSSKESQKNEYLKYPITDISIINMLNNGFIGITDTSVLSKEFTLSNQGSGYILIDGETASYKFNSFSVNLQGSGDIILENISSNLINLNLLGSGEIQISRSKSDNVDISLIGSGSIVGKHNVFKKIQQKKVGSGNISLNE